MVNRELLNRKPMVQHQVVTWALLVFALSALAKTPLSYIAKVGWDGILFLTPGGIVWNLFLNADPKFNHYYQRQPLREGALEQPLIFVLITAIGAFAWLSMKSIARRGGDPKDG